MLHNEARELLVRMKSARSLGFPPVTQPLSVRWKGWGIL